MGGAERRGSRWTRGHTSIYRFGGRTGRGLACQRIKALKPSDYAESAVITTVANPLQVYASRKLLELVFAFNFKKYIEKDKFSGAGNLFVPKSVFEKVGGFQQGVSEDVDWCWRCERSWVQAWIRRKGGNVPIRPAQPGLNSGGNGIELSLRPFA